MHFSHWMMLPAIRTLGLDSRAFFADLVAISQDPEEQRTGYLTEFDLPLTEREIGRHLGIQKVTLTRLLKELHEAGLLKSCAPKIYTVPMLFIPTVVREENERLKKSRAGKAGGNPALVRKPKPARPPVLYPSRHSPTKKIERKQFEAFWYHYPRKTNRRNARGAFVWHQFPDNPDEFQGLLDHLKNRTDPDVGDYSWMVDPKNIPSPVQFLKKRMWLESYKSRLEITG